MRNSQALFLLFFCSFLAGCEPVINFSCDTKVTYPVYTYGFEIHIDDVSDSLLRKGWNLHYLLVRPTKPPLDGSFEYNMWLNFTVGSLEQGIPAGEMVFYLEVPWNRQPTDFVNIRLGKEGGFLKKFTLRYSPLKFSSTDLPWTEEVETMTMCK
jgi:hypothetical protein